MTAIILGIQCLGTVRDRRTKKVRLCKRWLVMEASKDYCWQHR